MVLVALPGDYGKPRPALVIQSDLFMPAASITVLPLTSDLEGTPLQRVRVNPTHSNGLEKISDVMLDKTYTLPTVKIRKVIGSLSKAEMAQIDSGLIIFLGLV